MPVDWKAADSFNRLLAATVASMDGQTKLNYKRIADFYGEGATYDAIEGRFRIIKKQAAKLKEEVQNGRAIAPARGNGNGNGNGRGSSPSTPRKSRPMKNSSQDVVMTGRITKSTPSPAKKKSTQIKKETLESSTSASTSSAMDDATTPASSINIVEDSFNYDPDLTNFDLGFHDPSNSHMGTHGPMGFGGHSGHIDLDSFWDAEHVV